MGLRSSFLEINLDFDSALPNGTAKAEAGPDLPWMDALLGRAGFGADPGSTSALTALAACAGNAASVAGRVTRLVPEPLDRLILAALYLEGLHLDLRRGLRGGNGFARRDEEDGGTRQDMLSAECMVQWLGGDDQGLRQRVAERLLPQSGLSARRLIERRGAAAPLDGGVRLSPFLASLLYPGDGQGERALDSGLRLVQPSERLADVVLTPEQRKELGQFLAMCHSGQVGGKSILLWGRSGTGKTFTARALANELGLPLLLVRTENEDDEAGLIEKAAAAATIEGAALFFDECGRWLDKETHYHGPSAEAAMLLQVLQDHPGVIIAAMNQDWLRLSEAFQRRFPTQVCYGQTDDAQRAELWRRHVRRPVPPAVLERSAKLYDISGGLIRNAALRLNLGPRSAPVTWEDMQTAVGTQLHGSLEWEGTVMTSGPEGPIWTRKVGAVCKDWPVHLGKRRRTSMTTRMPLERALRRCSAARTGINAMGWLTSPNAWVVRSKPWTWKSCFPRIPNNQNCRRPMCAARWKPAA